VLLLLLLIYVNCYCNVHGSINCQCRYVTTAYMTAEIIEHHSLTYIQGPLSLVSTTEELLERKSNSSGLANREYGRRDPLC
jgi:hypothetical protein